MHTDTTDEKTRRIGELFPHCLTERQDDDGRIRKAIDFDLLRQELSGEIVEGNNERYQFTWPGKGKAIRLADTPTTDTLRPVRAESVNFDATQNLYIEGDNLKVLKLLRKSYQGKVKLIYIDPPYNTGRDFIYNDDFTLSSHDYRMTCGGSDAEDNGRLHTDWLNMMYPRLKVARDLLREDGVIFISIDDNELDNLKKICDEIFGYDNFVNCIAVKMSEPTGLKMSHQWRRFPKLKEYLLFYKKKSFERFVRLDKYKVTRWDSENNILLENFSREDRMTLAQLEEKETNDDDDVALANRILSKARKVFLSTITPCLHLSDSELSDWLFDNSYRIVKTAGAASLRKVVMNLSRQPSQDIAAARSAEGVLFYYVTDFNRNTAQPRLRVIFADTNLYKNPCDFWQDIKTSGGVAMEGGVMYKNGKKPLQLLNRIIKMTTENDDIILDFFSGSASTAHAVMDTNRTLGGHRRFIMVQLPEDLDTAMERAGGETRRDIKETIKMLDSIGKPHLLTELGKERIRRVGNKIKEEVPTPPDVGFRVFKLDTSDAKP